jgi:hypothetical protein
MFPFSTETGNLLSQIIFLQRLRTSDRIAQAENGFPATLTIHINSSSFPKKLRSAPGFPLGFCINFRK